MQEQVDQTLILDLNDFKQRLLCGKPLIKGLSIISFNLYLNFGR